MTVMTMINDHDYVQGDGHNINSDNNHGPWQKKIISKVFFHGSDEEDDVDA